MKKIVFISTSAQDPHAIKRANDFVAHGFEVFFYAFDRQRACNSVAIGYDISVVGSFADTMPYWKRLGIIYKGIKQAAQNHTKNSEAIFYYMGMDIALVATMFIHTPYIYEECDLVHTYLSKPLLIKAFELIDKHIMSKSLHTVLTSEGFVQYHKLKMGNHISLITNRLSPSIRSFPNKLKHSFDPYHLSFGFVGGVRYEALARFAETFAASYPQHKFHFFGFVGDAERERFVKLEKYQNIYFHGRFTNPNDLPEIYSQIDCVLATYDTDSVNVCYAEPNKLYEAIYFRTPIIVSSGTFLADKVRRLNIGWSVNAFDSDNIKSLIDSLTKEIYNKTVSSIMQIPQSDAIENNDDFFDLVKRLAKG